MFEVHKRKYGIDEQMKKCNICKSQVRVMKLENIDFCLKCRKHFQLQSILQSTRNNCNQTARILIIRKILTK